MLAAERRVFSPLYGKLYRQQMLLWLSIVIYSCDG